MKNFKYNTIISILLIITVMLFSSACSNNATGNSPNLTEITTSTDKKISDTKEEKIEQYIKSNVENMAYCSTTLQEDKALIMCTLNKEMQDSKINYYSFAESIVNATKIISKEYNLSFVNLNVYFFVDTDTSISWQTTDFGKSGTFTDRDDINDYKDVKYYSLSELKQYLSKYN